MRDPDDHCSAPWAPLTRDENIVLRTSTHLQRSSETHASGTPKISCARRRSRRHERSAAWAQPLLASSTWEQPSLRNGTLAKLGATPLDSARPVRLNASAQAEALLTLALPDAPVTFTVNLSAAVARGRAPSGARNMCRGFINIQQL